MADKIIAEWKDYRLESRFKGSDAKEYLLQAGNFNHHTVKIINTKWFNREVFNMWTPGIISNPKELLETFQRYLFHGLSASMGTEMFCESLGLDPDVKATEIRYDQYTGIMKKMSNLLHRTALEPADFANVAMAIIVHLRDDGVDCGLDIK